MGTAEDTVSSTDVSTRPLSRHWKIADVRKPEQPTRGFHTM